MDTPQPRKCRFCRPFYKQEVRTGEASIRGMIRCPDPVTGVRNVAVDLPICDKCLEMLLEKHIRLTLKGDR